MTSRKFLQFLCLDVIVTLRTPKILAFEIFVCLFILLPLRGCSSRETPTISEGFQHPGLALNCLTFG